MDADCGAGVFGLNVVAGEVYVAVSVKFALDAVGGTASGLVPLSGKLPVIVYTTEPPAGMEFKEVQPVAASEGGISHTLPDGAATVTLETTKYVVAGNVLVMAFAAMGPDSFGPAFDRVIVMVTLSGVAVVDRLCDKLQKVSEDAQPDIARFFGMELDAGDVASLHDGGKRLTVFRDGDRIDGHGCDEAVREIHLRSFRDAGDNRRLVSDRKAVPSDMRNFYRARHPGPPGTLRDARLRRQVTTEAVARAG